MSFDLLLEGGTAVTCDADDRVLVGDVAISRGAIVAIGPRARDALARPYRVLDARGCAVVPGFVQAHVHLVQALFRGMADDLPLLDWLRRFIWPLEAAHDEKSLRASAELGLCEMIRAGTTTILDMGTTHGHDAIFSTCERSGIRAVSGKAMMDVGDGVPRKLRETKRASLRESERLAKAWPKRGHGRLSYAFAPRFILSCSEALIRDAASLADELGALVHTHAAEHPAERAAVRQLLGDDDVTLLERWGVTGPKAILAHGVQLTDAEMRRLARRGTRVVHCPSANLKLGSGIARIHALRRAGVVVGLGADGAPCNNNLDPFVEMRHAALLAKARSGTTTLPAREVLRMATIDGATALGLGAITGSLEVGKRADVAVIRLTGEHVAPATDVTSALVYACQSRDVRHVVIDGQITVQSGELLTLDAPRAAAIARDEARRIGRVAGILSSIRPIGFLTQTRYFSPRAMSDLRLAPGLLAVVTACAIAMVPYGCSGSPTDDGLINSAAGSGGESATGGTSSVGGTGGTSATGKGGSGTAGTGGVGTGGASAGKGGTGGASAGAPGTGGNGAAGSQTFGQGGTPQQGAGGDPFGGTPGMGGNTAGGNNAGGNGTGFGGGNPAVGAGGMGQGPMGPGAGGMGQGPMGPGAGGMGQGPMGPGAGGMGQGAGGTGQGPMGPGAGGSSTTTGMGGSAGATSMPGPCSDGTCSGATECCKGLGQPCGTNLMFTCL